MTTIAEPNATPRGDLPERLSPRPGPVLSVEGVTRDFGARRALDRVDFEVGAGEIHALLGPNGAGKTTLIRSLCGLVQPTSGRVRVLGVDPSAHLRTMRSAVGLVPSGDRTFYLRLSGLENLLFFARLHGLRRRAAERRAVELLSLVGLEDAARDRVGHYSHGMQKRLSVARALIGNPAVLLVDEATHDLDPLGAADVRALVSNLASSGTAIAWATQRLDEIRGFADRVTLLKKGQACFVGSVAELIGYAQPRRFLLGIEAGTPDPAEATVLALAGLASVETQTPTHVALSLHPGSGVGTAVAALEAAGIAVVSCVHERSEIEEAFLRLTGTAE